MDKPAIHIEGMGGLGDNLHQRAVMRSLMQTHDVLLGTSWPSAYHDLIPQGLRIYHRPIALRTQLKNAAREKEKFGKAPSPLHSTRKVHMIYQRASVGSGTILQAMYACAGIRERYQDFDFSLPVPEAWHEQLSHVFDPDGVTKPLCVYRPLTVRPEYMGGAWRNANGDDYAQIFAAIRDQFHVVSLADLEENREWIVGPRLKADTTLHAGELHFEQMAALFQRADFVFTSSGFGCILAPAVGTPCVSVQGGYHPSSWQADGAKHAPWLGIDPVHPCDCASSGCVQNCEKKIDVPSAISAIREFVSTSCGISEFHGRTFGEMFDPQIERTVRPQPRVVPQRTRMTQPQLLALLQRQASVKA